MSHNVTGFTNRAKIDQEAAEWVLLLEDKPKLSMQQIEELNDWIAISDVHRESLEDMANSWGELDSLSQVIVPQEMRLPSILSRAVAFICLPLAVFASLISQALRQARRLLQPLVFVPTLACVLAVVVLVHHQLDNKVGKLYLSTTLGETLHHSLPDGSILWLNSSSKVQVNYNEGFRRIHLLEGEGHFEVAKNATRPFEVYVDDRLVRAIGTAFSVHKVGDTIEVLVSEGTVELAIVDNTLVVTPDDFEAIKNIDSVSEKTTSAKLPAKLKQTLGQLSAGQRIAIPVNDVNLETSIDLDSSEVTRSLSWKEGKLVFAGETLEEVIKEITRHTLVKIDLLDPQLKSMRIGGQFKIGETDALFYVLESGFGISVEKLSSKHVQLRVD